LRIAPLLRLVAVLGAAALGGCTGPVIADYNTSFTSASPDALVIIGLAGGGKHLTNDAGNEVYPQFGLTWTRTQPDKDGDPVSFHAVPMAAGLGTAKERRQMHYTLYTLPPGRYVLTQIDATEYRVKLQKNYLTPITGGTIAFDALSGKITYLGDFVVDASGFPAKLERHERNDAAAFAELKNYPTILAPLRYAAPIAIAPPKKNATMFK
jgi:hypothetical protein